MTNGEQRKRGRPRLYSGCKVENCPAKHDGKGYCSKHLVRLRKHGDPNHCGQVGRPRLHLRCTVENCEAEHSAKGYCANHYQRWRKYGRPDKVIQRVDTVVSQRRHELGLNLRQLGERCNVSYEAIRQYEKGTMQPRRETLVLLSAELGLSVEQIMRHFQIESLKRRIPGVQIDERPQSDDGNR